LEVKTILTFSASRAPCPCRQSGFKWIQQTFMVIPVVPSKREVIKIPLGKHKALLSPKLDLVCVDGEPDKSTGPASTPSIMCSGDELAKRQGLLLVIRFHG
jgi:hypothetical protein